MNQHIQKDTHIKLLHRVSKSVTVK